MKKCFKCDQDLPLAEFYRHPRMADGHLGKCKSCTKQDVATYRKENPEMVAARKRDWSRSPNGRAAARRCAERRAVEHPDQTKAVWMVNNAVKWRHIRKLPCFVCGAAKTEGHHADYSRPLDVIWLCKKHHVETHQLAKQLKRKEVQ